MTEPNAEYFPETWWEVRPWQDMPAPVGVDRSTDTYVFIDGRRRARVGDGCGVFPTAKDAVAFMRFLAGADLAEADRIRSRADANMAKAIRAEAVADRLDANPPKILKRSEPRP